MPRKSTLQSGIPRLTKIPAPPALILELLKILLILSPWVVAFGMFHYNFQSFWPYPGILKGPKFFDFFTEIDFFIILLSGLFLLGIITGSIRIKPLKTPIEIIVSIGLLLLAGLIQLEFQQVYEPVLSTPFKYLRSLVLLPLVLFMITFLTMERKDVFRLLKSYLLMISTICLFSLIQYFFTVFPGDTTDFTGRLSWPYVDFITLKSASSNWLAFLTAPALVISFIESFNAIRKKRITAGTWIFFLTMVLTTAVIYLVQSYGAYSAIFAAMALYFFRSLKFKQLIIGFIILLLAGTAIYLIQKDSAKVQIMEGKIDYKYQNSVTSRKDIYIMNYHIITEHALMGVGPNQYQSYFASHYQDVLDHEFKELHFPPHAHNFFLSFWTSLGLFGFLGIFILIAGIFWRFRLSPDNPALFAIAAMMVHGLIDVYYWRQEIACLFWVVVVFTYLYGGRYSERG